MDEQAKTILAVLGELLEPLGPDRKKLILGWVAREIQTHAIVQYVYEEGPPVTRVYDAQGDRRDESGQPFYEAGGPQIWRIGEPSPLIAQETVFAMFQGEAGPVTAYSFMPVEVDGRSAVYFFRSVICKPVHVHGPVHHNALVGELGFFLAEEDEKIPGIDIDAEPGDDDEPESERAPARATNGA